MKERRIAYDILVEVILNKEYANLAMRKLSSDLTPIQKSLITQIVYGTLRNYRYVRYQWADYVEKINEKIGILIDMSVYQLLFLDKLPAYAIVNEANNIAPKSYKGLVNAVLHKVIDNGVKDTDELDIKYSCPKWIYQLLVKQYDQKIAEDILKTFTLENKIYYRLNTLRTNKETIEQEYSVTFLDEICFVSEDNLLNSDGFKNGDFVIQDYASQQVVKQLDLKNDQIILDMCASPGTKTSEIAMMLNNTGKIIALDIHEHRVKLISTSMVKLGIMNVETKCMDATKANECFENESFDQILLDAPCSGIGVIGRKPDIKITLTPSDLDNLIILQKNLLETASVLLKKGGTLVYSTCTINKKENERQIKAFLENHDDYSLQYEKTNIPDINNGDGFYYAKLKREH